MLGWVEGLPGGLLDGCGIQVGGGWKGLASALKEGVEMGSCSRKLFASGSVGCCWFWSEGVGFIGVTRVVEARDCMSESATRVF